MRILKDFITIVLLIMVGLYVMFGAILQESYRLTPVTEEEIMEVSK